MTSIDATFWKEAIKSEIDSLKSNKTWELTDLPKGVDQSIYYINKRRIILPLLSANVGAIHENYL